MHKSVSKKLKPDTILKNYWSDNDRFADLFNAVLFAGEQVIRPEELTDADTEDSTILEHREYREALQASRDGLKIRKWSSVLGVELVLLGIEGQERIHYAMPMRVMGYDYGTYKKQYDDNALKYRHADGLTPDEFLSRMRSDDKFVPVITVVVYYGEKPWDGAVSLHGMLRIPEQVKPLVNDYKMRLVEARKNDLTLHNLDNQDLFNLLQILLDRSASVKEAREKAVEYSRAHDTDKTVVMTVAGATGNPIDDRALEKEGDGMCTVFEELKNEGRAEGREEGRAEGREEGREEGRAEGREEGRANGIIEMGLDLDLPEDDILHRLQVKLNISLETAKRYMQMFQEQMV